MLNREMTVPAPESTLIELHGQRYWLTHGIDRSGPVTSLDHCDEHGNLNLETCFKTESYAHCFPQADEILRYGKKIGGRKDIVLVEKHDDSCGQKTLQKNY